MTTINIHINTLKEFFEIEDMFQTLDSVKTFLSKQKIQKMKQFAKSVSIKGYTKMKKEELISLFLDNINIELSSPVVSDSDDEEDEGEEDEGEEDEGEEEEEVGNVSEETFPVLHFSENQLTNFINAHEYSVILLCSDECDPCVKFKPKFINLCNEHIEFSGAILNVDLYEENVGKIEPDVEYLPTVKICKNGEVKKVLEAPTVKKLEKEVLKIINMMPSIKEMKEELKKRGLSLGGKKDELYQRILDDNRSGELYHEKSREELIQLLTSLKVRSKKHEEMDEIALIKKIRKEVEKRKLQSETRYEHLTARFNPEDNSKITIVMKDMTVKQLRILADHGFLSSSSSSSFEYKKREENGESIKALTKMQIIEEFRKLIEN